MPWAASPAKGEAHALLKPSATRMGDLARIASMNCICQSYTAAQHAQAFGVDEPNVR